MVTQHDYYEELCALAATGQIAPDQLKSLKLHMETCASCLDTFTDFGQIAGHVIESGSRRMSPKCPSGMTDRFIARAHSEGVPLSTPTSGRQTRKRWLRNSAFALAAGVILFVGLKILSAELRSAMPTGGPKLQVAIETDVSPRADLRRENSTLAQQVEELHKQINELAADLKAEQKALERSESEKLQVSARFSQLESDNNALRQGLAERDARILSLNAEAARNNQQFDQLLSAKSAGDFRLKTEQSELTDLRAKVASLAEEINERQQLSAAAEQAKELIVARKLHIVDVDDTDGNGKRERPFGRIFYTEGHNLVFYAYDLNDPRKLDAKINFYVWGASEGDNKRVRNLGIFHADDTKDARWVLKFNDPGVLAEINCVFVTAETNKKPVTQPTGRQILFASLGPRPNHP